jgi:CelD/BcsL family acetyltransferase involved in cellulose biosynthesis
MLTPMWLVPWWRVWGSHDGRRLRVVLFREADRLVGLAPLLWRRHWHRGVVPLRRLEPLGSGERPGERVCSDYLNVIAERGRERAVVEALAQTVAAGHLGGWDELVIPAMAGDGPMPGLLTEAFGRCGASAVVTPADTAPYAALPASWDAYLQAMPGSRRYYLNKSLRDFEKWAGDGLRFHEATAPAELEEGQRLLRALHAERWSADGQAGVFGARQFAAFHEAAMPELLRGGALELTWLTVRGEPVAVQYNLAWANKVCTYQSGRKMDVPRNVRPGLVLHLRLIRRAIEAGRREYDFLAGVSRYKQELATAARPLVDFRAARPTPAEHARRAVEAVADWARAARNRLRRAQPTHPATSERTEGTP